MQVLHPRAEGDAVLEICDYDRVRPVKKNNN